MDEARIFPYTPKEAEAAGIEHGLKEINKALPFPARLRELRKAQSDQPSQQTLAERVGITKTMINLYEAGENVPDARTIAKLADYYKVSTDYILCRTDDPSIHSDMRTAVKVTRLSKEAIEALRDIELDEELDELLGVPQDGITKMQVVNGLLSAGSRDADAPSFGKAVALLRAAVASALKGPAPAERKEPVKAPPGYIAVPVERARRYALVDAKALLDELVDQVYTMYAGDGAAGGD